MIDEFLNSAQSEYDSLKAHCDFIERENRALTKEIEMCDKKIDKLRATRDKAIELNKQVIKDTKEFYRPTKDIIYSGDTLIDIAEQNLKILKEVE